MSGRRLLLLSIITLATAACVVGGEVDRIPSATNPRGAGATLHVHNGLPIPVELLVADDSVLTVLRRDSVQVVAWRRLDRINVARLGSFKPPFDEAEVQRLRRYSRFPYGISAETMAALLRNAGQDEPAIIE